jgi:hypothetical protein
MSASFSILPMELRLRIYEYFLPFTVYASHRNPNITARSMFSRDVLANLQLIASIPLVVRSSSTQYLLPAPGKYPVSTPEDSAMIRGIFSLAATSKILHAELNPSIYSSLAISASSVSEMVALASRMSADRQDVRTISLKRLAPCHARSPSGCDISQTLLWYRLLSQILPGLTRVDISVHGVQHVGRSDLGWDSTTSMLLAMMPETMPSLCATSIKRVAADDELYMTCNVCAIVRFEKVFSHEEGFEKCDFQNLWDDMMEDITNKLFGAIDASKDSG